MRHFDAAALANLLLISPFLTKVLPNRTLWNSHIDLKYIGNNRRVNIQTRYHEAANAYSGLFFKIWAKYKTDFHSSNGGSPEELKDTHT